VSLSVTECHAVSSKSRRKGYAKGVHLHLVQGPDGEQISVNTHTEIARIVNQLLFLKVSKPADSVRGNEARAGAR
jgi:hypothetical protein